MNFYDFVQVELPENLKLDGTWLEMKKTYWDLFLDPGIETIPEECREENFDELVEALKAKLCVYDAMVLAGRGSYIAFLGGGFSTSQKNSGHKPGMPPGQEPDPDDPDNVDPDMMVDPDNPFPNVGSEDSGEAGGSVKKIVTGPTEVEFFDTADALNSMFSSSKYSKPLIDNLFNGLCALANRIGIKIPYCTDDHDGYGKRFRVGKNWPIVLTSKRRRYGIRRPKKLGKV